MTNVENSRALFLLWLKNEYPDLYSQALSITLNASPFDASANDFLVPQELGQYLSATTGNEGGDYGENINSGVGLGRFGATTFNEGGDYGENINSGVGLGGVSDWAAAFSDLLKNVGGVATQYLTTKAEVDQVKTNVNRINVGLPPLNANGTVMTADQMRAAGYSDSSISQIEANMVRSGSLASAGVGGVPWWAIGIAAAGLGYVVLRKR